MRRDPLPDLLKPPADADEEGGLRLRTVWISDLHLGTPGCQAEPLLQFLKTVECDTLYLVGDIVDGWQLKRQWYWPQAHNDVVQKILRLARKGVRVNCVSPGTVESPWVRRLVASTADPEATYEGLRKRQPMGDLVSCEAVADAVAYLAAATTFTTGVDLLVDGGLSQAWLGLIPRPGFEKQDAAAAAGTRTG
mgnify:CR=1 FL=1